jgi:hypothetical protein
MDGNGRETKEEVEREMILLGKWVRRQTGCPECGRRWVSEREMTYVSGEWNQEIKA